MELLFFAVSLVVMVGGLAYLLELRNPLRNWLLTLALLLPVVALVALVIHSG